jgi:hypothetical protein
MAREGLLRCFSLTEIIILEELLFSLMVGHRSESPTEWLKCQGLMLSRPLIINLDIEGTK